jgi:hypothetical protein
MLWKLFTLSWVELLILVLHILREKFTQCLCSLTEQIRSTVVLFTRIWTVQMLLYDDPWPVQEVKGRDMINSGGRV